MRKKQVDFRQYASEIVNTFFAEALTRAQITYSDIQKMLQDETVAASLDILVNAILRMLGTYTHPEQDKKQFIDYCLEQQHTSFQRRLRRLVRDYLAYGVAIAEIVYKHDGLNIILDDIIPLRQEYISFLTERDERNRLQIKAVRYMQSSGAVEIPYSKCLVFTRGNTVFETESILERSYRAYRIKEMLLKFWAIAMERFAAPIVLGKTGGDTKQMVNVLKTLYRNGVIAVDREDSVEILETSKDIGQVFTEAIEFANKLIMRGMLIPSMLIRQDQVGAYALAKVHLQVFEQTVSTEAEYIAEVIIDQLIAPLLTFNFADVSSFGKFETHREVDLETKLQLADLFDKMLSAGVLDLAVDSNFIREALNFPKLE